MNIVGDELGGEELKWLMQNQFPKTNFECNFNETNG